MRRLVWCGALGAAVLLTAGLLLAAGCGGSGGPVGQPQGNNEGPSPTRQFTDLLPAGQKDATYSGSGQCQNCHAVPQGSAHGLDFAAWSQTRHAQLSIGCEQCHGPASAHVAAPSKNNILTYPKITSELVCAQCHGPKTGPFDASKHAQVVEEVVEESEASASTGRTCMRCHSTPLRVQLIQSNANAGESPDDIQTRIANTPDAEIVELAKATNPHEHPETAATAGCGVCHDPHKKTGKLDAHLVQNGVIQRIEHQLTRTVFSEDTSALQPGTPQQISSNWDHICGTCHNGRGSNPADSALKTGTARPNFHEGPQMNMLLGVSGSEMSSDDPGTPAPAPAEERRTSHAEIPGQCSHCHMPDGSHAFSVNLDKSCAPCHSPEDAQARLALRGTIQLRLFALRTRMQRWAKATFGDQDLWDYTTLVPAGKTAPPQDQVPIQIKRARHNYYFVLRDRSYGIHNAKYTRYLLDNADHQLDALGVARAANTRPSQQAVLAAFQFDLARGRTSSVRER